MYVYVCVYVYIYIYIYISLGSLGRCPDVLHGLRWGTSFFVEWAISTSTSPQMPSAAFSKDALKHWGWLQKTSRPELDYGCLGVRPAT